MITKKEFIERIGDAIIDADKISTGGLARGTWTKYSNGGGEYDPTIAYLSGVIEGRTYAITIENLDAYNPPTKSNVVFVDITGEDMELDAVPDEVGIAAVDALPLDYKTTPYGAPNSISMWIMETLNVDQKTANTYLVIGAGLIIACVVVGYATK